jgi:hypothetical protein
MGKRAELTIREAVSVGGVKTVGTIRSLISSELSIMAQGINGLVNEQPSPLKSDIRQQLNSLFIDEILLAHKGESIYDEAKNILMGS